MKKLISVFCIVALVLCGCANVNEEHTPAPETTQPVGTTGAVNAMDLPMPAAYDKLLQELINAFPNVSGLTDYPTLSHMYDGHTALAELGWAMEDLDGDGTPELLIKSLESPFMYDAFTMQGETLVDLFSGGENDSYRLYEEGLLEVQWSDGTAMGTDYYRLEQGSIVRFDRVVQDPARAAELGLVADADQADPAACWFRSATDNKQDYSSITAIEAAGIQQAFKDDNFPLYPTFLSLADYKN